MADLKTSLRKEKSENCSGNILNEWLIPILPEKHYYIIDYKLDGDAPKQFIRAWFFEKDSGIRKINTSSWTRYIAKTAEKWYPHESVTEFMINRIGQVLALRINDVRLVKANSQIRFLSRFFLSKNERLIHGAEICGEHLNDMDMAEQIANDRKTSRALFNFEFICNAIKTVYPEHYVQIIKDLVKMLVFDAVVGNNDRHFYNWGVIDTTKKSKKIPTFAPVYDSARGLLWNTSDEGVKHLYDLHSKGGKKIDNYVNKALPRISLEENSEVNHFDLIRFIVNTHPNFREILNALISIEAEIKVSDMLKKEFFPMFIPERCSLILIILQTRFKKLREV